MKTKKNANNKKKKLKDKNKRPGLGVKHDLQSKKQMKKKKIQRSLEAQIVRQKDPFISRKILQNMSLRERMLQRLKSARFRYINEQLYQIQGKDALKYFTQDRNAFHTYHAGYQQQVKQWPVNPLHVIIRSLKSIVKPNTIVADFGCGTAELAKSFPHTTVHSFDLVSLDPRVKACDMAHTPLKESTVDVAVFCLSLMGTNLNDYIKEANRVLKPGGLLKIAEVESRFDNAELFIRSLSKFGFNNVYKNFEHNIFYFMDFKKDRVIGQKAKKKLPDLVLKPCLYKKR